jgi:serine/threonine protein kinase
LTPRNILLSPCVGVGHPPRVYLADFGLSLLTKSSKYYTPSGKERQAEFCSLTEAGTLRYMAPELLEGAVNLKDCENALKQADVYSLSLVLWEVNNACRDIRVDEGSDATAPPPDDTEENNKNTLHQPPFYDETNEESSNEGRFFYIILFHGNNNKAIKML